MWKFEHEQNSNLLKRHSTEVNMHVQINIVERFSISIWTRHTCSWPEWDKHRKVRWNTRGKLLSYILYLFSCRTWSFLWYTSFFKVDISEIVFLLQIYYIKIIRYLINCEIDIPCSYSPPLKFSIKFSKSSSNSSNVNYNKWGTQSVCG